MSNPSEDRKTDARRLVEASAWCTHLTENDLDTSPQFEAWLAADADNLRAWQQVNDSWTFFGEQATAPELLDLRRKALGQAHDTSRRRWSHGRFTASWKPVATWGLAASTCIIAFAVAMVWNLSRSDSYRTAAGERRVVTLSDGSQVQLDALTELKVSYSDRARDLSLIEGQARFDVAHDVERPFSVLAAGQKVIATGTAFNVDLLGPDLLVTLIEGRVVVVRKSSQPIELTAGEQLTVSEHGNPTVRPASVERAIAWQSGRIVLDNEPLSSVIVRINRYATRRMLLGDEQTGALRISGVFDTGDIDGFVGTLTHYLPVEAQATGDSIVLRHR